MPDTSSKVTSVIASNRGNLLTLRIADRDIAMCHIKWHN
jgi:hypothetical protein